MGRQDELSAQLGQPDDPCAVLHRALRFLLPMRETSKGRPGDQKPIPRTVQNLSDVLVAADRLATSNTLTVDCFNLDLWPYVTGLKDESTLRPDSLNYYVIAEHVDFVIEALKFTCLQAGCGIPRDLSLNRATRRGVVTEHIEPRQRRMER
jgi:hypothetical protein